MADQGARDWYEKGVEQHYRRHAADYRNPHAEVIDAIVKLAVARWPIERGTVCDLACGAGEFTLALRAALGEAMPEVVGLDPFTAQAYTSQTGGVCEAIGFEQIVAGEIRGQRFSLIGCSFAMHLCPISLLPALCMELAQRAGAMLIITPHKRPTIQDDWGWEPLGEILHQRVRARGYRSQLI